MIPAAPVRGKPLLVRSLGAACGLCGVPAAQVPAGCSVQAEGLVGHEGLVGPRVTHTLWCSRSAAAWLETLCASNPVSMGVGTERVKQSNCFLFK